jgi:hypothetical protein
MKRKFYRKNPFFPKKHYTPTNALLSKVGEETHSRVGEETRGGVMPMAIRIHYFNQQVLFIGIHHHLNHGRRGQIIFYIVDFIVVIYKKLFFLFNTNQNSSCNFF